MKIDQFDFTSQDQEVIDFKDKVTEVINFGKFGFQKSSIVPTWTGRTGEMCFYQNGTDGRLYAFMGTGGTTWTIVASFTV